MYKTSEKRNCKRCGMEYISKGKDLCDTCFSSDIIDTMNRIPPSPPYAVKVQYTEASKESIKEILDILHGADKPKKPWWQFWK
jgi:hypothetical protein